MIVIAVEILNEIARPNRKTNKIIVVFTICSSKPDTRIVFIINRGRYGLMQ